MREKKQNQFSLLYRRLIAEGKPLIDLIPDFEEIYGFMFSFSLSKKFYKMLFT